MQYGTLKGVEKQLSRLVVGARGFEDSGQCFEHYDAYFEAGYTIWDTAHSYYDGNTDRLIGEWMESRNIRDQVAVLAKGCNNNRDRKKLTTYDLESELFDSLACLRTDYVDIFMLHRDDPDVEVGLIIESLHQHWEEGRIKAYGASNWTHQRIGEANAYAKKHGLQPFTVSGPQLSLLGKIETDKHWWHDCPGIGGSAGREAREWYKDEGVAIFGYSPLAVGFLNGSIIPSNIKNLIHEGKLDELSIDGWYNDENMGYLARAIEMSKRNNLSVPQVALRYITSLAANGILDSYAIVGSSNVKHALDNAAATEENFTPEEIAWLEMKIEKI